MAITAQRFAILAAVATLSACSGPIETRITSVGLNGQLPTARFQLVAPPGEQDALTVQASMIVNERMKALGWQPVDKDGQYVVAVSLAERPASFGVETNSGSQEATSTLARPKKRRFLQSCKDVEHRLDIAITRIADGANFYQGSAAEYHCKAGLVETLPVLVDAAIADIGAPQGSRVALRSGRE